MSGERRHPKQGEAVHAGIPEHGRVPLYFAVRARLLDLIQTLGEGSALPSERDLADLFDVSRLAVRQAVGELVLEGRLTRRQGVGTFVAPPKLVRPMSLSNLGFEPTLSLVTLEHLPAANPLAAELGVRVGAMIVHIERVVAAHGDRIGLESTYLAAERFPGLSDRFDPAESLHAHLRDVFGVTVADAEERVETILATPREAQLIGVSQALPMLLLNRLTRDGDGRPIDRARSLFRGDRFSIIATLRE
jgi:GntR family transcriptional regulator